MQLHFLTGWKQNLGGRKQKSMATLLELFANVDLKLGAVERTAQVLCLEGPFLCCRCHIPAFTVSGRR